MTPQEYYAKELAALEPLWRNDGRLIALHDAVAFCQEVEIPLPSWAAEAVLALIYERHYQGGDSAGAWRSPRGRLAKDVGHYRRWRALSVSLMLAGSPKAPTGRPKPDNPYRCAVQEALRQFPGTTEKQLRGSYDRVEQSLAKGETRFAFERLYSL